MKEVFCCEGILSMTYLALNLSHYPSKYVPEYGGFYAYNMSKGQMKDCDPTISATYKGKLYRC